MASFLPSSIQKRVLRYVLLRTDLLDTDSLSLDSLDIALGRQNKIELRDVGLRVQRIASLLNLPPQFHVDSAQVLLLRITIPADLYHDSIKAEMHGIHCRLSLRPHHQDTTEHIQKPSQHQRTARKSQLPTNLAIVDDPSDLAQSFLLDDSGAEHSAIAEDSEAETETGTGTSLGLPTFLAAFIQGIVDRFEAVLLDLIATLHITSSEELTSTFQHDEDHWATLMLSVSSVRLSPARSAVPPSGNSSSLPEPAPYQSRRNILVENVKLVVRQPLPRSGQTTPRDNVASSEADQLRAQSGRSTPTASSPLQPFVSAPRSPSPSGVGDLLAGQPTYGDFSQDIVQDVMTQSQILDPVDIQAGEDSDTWRERQSRSHRGHTEFRQATEPLPDLLASAMSRYRFEQDNISYRSKTLVDVDSPTYSSTQDVLTSSALFLANVAGTDIPDFDSQGLEAVTVLSDLPSGRPSDSNAASTVDQTRSPVSSSDLEESIYMSTILPPQSHEPSAADEQFKGLPGQWNFDDDTSESPDLCSSRSAEHHRKFDLPRTISSDDNDNGPADQPSLEAHHDMNEAISSAQHTLIHIDKVELWLSQSPTSCEIIPVPTELPDRAPKVMPGSFSLYAEQSASVHFDSSHLKDTTASLAHSDPGHPSPGTLEAFVPSVVVELRPSLLRLGLSLWRILAPDSSGHQSQSARNSTMSSKPLAFVVHLDSFRLSLYDQMTVPSALLRYDIDPSQGRPAPLISCHLADSFLCRSDLNGHIIDRLVVGRAEMTFAGERVVSFLDTSGSSVSSTVQRRPDITCKVSHAQQEIPSENSSVTIVSVETNCLIINLDLSSLDARLAASGGLSGIIELSASMLSSGTSIPVAPSSSRKKGVRFEARTQPSSHGPVTKVNVKFAGLHMTASGVVGYLLVKSSAVKLVIRPQYIALVVDRMSLQGSIDRLLDTTASPAMVSLDGLRLEYLYKPRDKDLERLISLLTPTKNKYENDDDILLDTLMRQRRGGALLSFGVNHAQIKIVELKLVDDLRSLFQEMAGFSAMAKYLPQDDRPGLLIMVRIKAFEVEMHGLPLLEIFQVRCDDISAAHIAIPALFTLAIGQISAQRPREPAILHAIMDPPDSEATPALMCRFIGDEMEPILRAKMYNVCLEYSLAAFFGNHAADQHTTLEEIIETAASTLLDAASSIVLPSIETPTTSKPAEVKLSRSSKRLKIDILLHECAVGLQPQNRLSKAMLVLDNARATALLPPDQILEVNTELRKAFIFVVDDFMRSDAIHGGKSIERSSQQTHSATLIDKGFVSVVSISSASLTSRVTHDLSHATQYVKLDLRNELIVLESCADSFQTMIQVFEGLVPPPPPSDEPKFRIEPVAVQDMISSFSGDAFEDPPASPSTVFDANDSVAIDDDALSEYDMSASIYGGLDALADEVETRASRQQVSQQIAESLLEEDPYEMPTSLATARLSNNDLLRHLLKQVPSSTKAPPVVSKPYWLPPSQIDASSCRSDVLGTSYRWNTPRSEMKSRPSGHETELLPFQLRFRNRHFIFNLHDGFDWPQTREAITDAVEEIEAKVMTRRGGRRGSREVEDEQESIIGDCLFNSIYVGIAANKDPSELRRHINRGIDDLASESESYATSGVTRPSNMSSEHQQHAKSKSRPRRLKLERSKTHKIAIETKGLSADVKVYARGNGEVQNSIDVSIRDVEIFDNVPTSTWRKFMTSYHEAAEEREMGKPMMRVEILTLRPVPDLAATELSMKVSVLPLRMHVDQDALDFMTRFFAFKDMKASLPQTHKEEAFLQRVEVNKVDLYLDYKPKRVDYGGLRSGRYTEFKNFFILDKAHIVLKHAIVYGVRGFDALHDTLNDVWMPDIRRNQLPGVLGGLASVSSLVSIGAGFVDVVAIPVQEYKKDGRLMRSIGKGTVHFMRNTTSEIARFGAKVAIGTQNVLQSAETMLSAGDAGSWHDVQTEANEAEQTRAVSNYADQPLGVLQGLKSARRHLERDLLTAKDALIAVQGEVMDSQSASSAASALARHAPTIILRPVIGASRAVGQTLMGVGNQVDKANVRKIDDKYKRS